VLYYTCYSYKYAGDRQRATVLQPAAVKDLVVGLTTALALDRYLDSRGLWPNVVRESKSATAVAATLALIMQCTTYTAKRCMRKLTLCVRRNETFFARAEMNKHISRLVLCMLLVTFVVAYIYYRPNEDDVLRNKSTSILQYIPEVKCQPQPASENNSTTSCVTGRPCTYPDVVDLRVIVITFNRPESLSKLLRSLDTLVLDGHSAALEIWIDRDRKNNVDQRTLEVASAFRWKGGPTRVHVQVYVCTAWYSVQGRFQGGGQGGRGLPSEICAPSTKKFKIRPHLPKLCV